MSNLQAQGFVQRITDRDGQYGKMYSIQVDGNWYSVGKYPPKVAVGDYIELEYKLNGNYRNGDYKSIRKASSGSAATAPQQGSSGSVSAAPYVDKRQDTISTQWAINAAIQYVNILTSADALPNLKKTATATEKYDYLNALMMDKASEFLVLAIGKELAVPQATQSQNTDDSQPDEEWK